MLDVTVELGRFTGFILDDPNQGILDTDVLDGDIDYLTIPQGVFGVSTSRGRNKDLERTSAGQLSVELRNEDRFFDPIGGSVVSYVKPRTPVRVFTDAVPVFTGFVDDWNFSYDVSGQSTASIDGTDGFSRFARQVNGGGSVVSQTTGVRLGAVLDQSEVAYTGLRDIDAGDSTLAAGLLEGETLNYMLDVVEQSELGLVFMAKDGTFTFRSRLFSSVGSGVKFSDNGSGVPFSGVEVVFGSEDLVNEAIVTGPNGTAIRQDLTSQVIYGVTAKTIDTQLSTLTQQEGLADYVIARYNEPEFRIQSIQVNMKGLSPAQVSEVLGLELGERVLVEWTPNRIGSPIAVQNRVIGISHDVSLDSYFVTLNLETLEFAFFVLDDPEFGILDSDAGVLGF